jgi:hypothetical protein
VSSNPQFEHAIQVPEGFTGNALPVPRPVDGQLYIRLRDDPSVANTTTLQAQQLAPSADELARAATRHAAATSEDEPAGASVPAPPSAVSALPSPVPAPPRQNDSLVSDPAAVPAVPVALPSH